MSIRCEYCRGVGIDPYDRDPMGGSMNSPCHLCGGSGLSPEGKQKVREEKIIKAIDDAWERNW